MKTVICSSKPAFSFRIPKITAIPQTPVMPIIGGRNQTQRMTDAAALSFSQYSGQAQGPFSFIHPDVPSERKAEKSRPLIPESLINKQSPAEDQDFPETSAGKPRFRSALEQVSHYTNESAMRRK